MPGHTLCHCTFFGGSDANFGGSAPVGPEASIGYGQSMLSVAGMILGTAGYMAPIPAPSKFSGAGRLTDHVSPRWLTGSFGITRDELGAQPRSLPTAQQFTALPDGLHRQLHDRSR